MTWGPIVSAAWAILVSTYCFFLPSRRLKSLEMSGSCNTSVRHLLLLSHRRGRCQQRIPAHLGGQFWLLVVLSDEPPYFPVVRDVLRDHVPHDVHTPLELLHEFFVSQVLHLHDLVEQEAVAFENELVSGLV